MKKIKILHIAQSAGGVANYIQMFLNNIKNEEYENVLVLSEDYKNYKKINNEENKIYYVDMIRNINLLKDFKAIKKIYEIVKRENPDIVYLHSSKAGALGRIALLLTKYKIIYNAHGWYFNADIGKKRVIYQLIEKILAFRTRKIITISKSEYESALTKHICRKNKLKLIENGIDIEKYDKTEEKGKEIREQLGISKDAIIVGIVGRIDEQKDPITSIAAAEKIIKQNPKIYFVFVGKGSLENEIINYANEKEISKNIIITGWVEDSKPYIEMFDIALLPSKWEGFGLAIVEYMMCKKPIIATRIGGIADILNKNESGFFIEKGNSDDIVKQIKYILEHPQYIEEIVERNYVECKTRFNITKEINAHIDLFNEII